MLEASDPIAQDMSLRYNTGRERRMAASLARQDLPYDTGQEAASRLAPPQLPVCRIPAAAQHSEHRDHCRPKHAEFVAPFWQRPYIADLKMSAQQHRHQQIHRSEQGNGAREESQCESDGGNELDRSGECNLHHRQRHAQAPKIERVDVELKGPAEDVTSEMRHEHQADIDSNERQCRLIERYLPRIRRCCDRCGPQHKLDEHKSTQKPTQNLK